MRKKGIRNLITFMFLMLMISVLGAETTSLTLEECIQYGWENSTEISRANNEVAINQSSLEQSKSALLPNLTFNINQNLSSSQNYDANTDDWNSDSNSNTSFSLNSSITLYNGAKLLNSIRQKKTELSASELEIQTEKEILCLEILTAYIEVLLAEEQYSNSEIQLLTTEKQVEYAEVKKAAGIISNADYLNIKSQLASDKASLITAKSQLRINYVSLMQTMDMPMQDSLNIVTPDIENIISDKLEYTSEEIYNTALKIRPEIKTENLNLESSKLEIKIAKADYLPSLKLNGSLDTYYNDALSEVGFEEQFENQIEPSIGLSLSIPIFQRKQVKNQVTQAKISAKNSELNLIDIKNSLRKNIEQAYTEAIVAEMTYRASTEQLQAEQESYLLAEEMFSQGLINSVDYMSSKDNYMDAESSLTQTKFNLILKTKVIEYYLGNPIKL